MAMNELRERVTRLEDFVGDPQGDNAVSLSIANEQHTERFLTLQTFVTDLRKEMDDRFVSVMEDLTSLTDVMKENFKKLEDEMALLKRAIVTPHCQIEGATSKIKVPEPKCFCGSRNSKELENFLWDMDQYFKAARIPVGDQVTITSMYLSGDAKLWWRTRMEDDACAGRPIIETWEALKKELRDQFLPCNTAWVARESLKKIKHSGSVRDYVKEFSSLMLDIRNMSEEDKLFNFLSGLQPWAQAELRRRAVSDIPSALAAAEGLVDFKYVSSSDTEGEGKKGNGAKKGKASTSKDGQSRDGKKKDNGDGKQKGKSTGCYLCNGPHFARDCPKREKLSALIVQSEDDDGEDAAGESPTRMNPLQLISAMSMGNQSRLMFVAVKVNGKEAKAMIDTGATSNFVSRREAVRLGLRMVQNPSKMKAVNATAKPIEGSAVCTLKVGTWEDQVNLMVVHLDDFDLVLGIEFLTLAKVIVATHLSGILIGDERTPCFVEAMSSGDKGKSVQKNKGELSSGKATLLSK